MIGDVKARINKLSKSDGEPQAIKYSSTLDSGCDDNGKFVNDVYNECDLVPVNNSMYKGKHFLLTLP